MTDVTVPFTGWGRAGFGELAWSEGSVAVGSATGQVGTVTVVEGTGVVVNVTGLSATGQVGCRHDHRRCGRPCYGSCSHGQRRHASR
jgi:hypothetical protein